MKLRIEGNTVRFRLKQGEVARLAGAGRLEAALRFGPAPGARFVYALEAAAGLDRLGARYESGRLTVLLPAARVQAWASSDEVGLEGTYHGPAGETVQLLVEKDFKCLHREGSEEDTFPNPAANPKS